MPLTMPSTAWSIGASSKTMLAALPPSSSVTFFVVPAIERAIILPTSVEPVNATLSTSGVLDQRRPVSPAPVTMLTTPGGRSACWQISANSSAVSGVVSAGLSTTVLPHGQRRRDLPRQHEQREVPRDDLAGHAERLGVGPEAGVLELVGPAGVVEEVRGDQRDVDVARLADRLAVVERLEHRELARPLLDDPGDAEQVLAALARRHRRPHLLVRPAGGGDGAVDVGRAGLGDLGQHLLGGGVDRLEGAPVDGSTNWPSMNRPYDGLMSTIARDSGAGAYSNFLPAMALSPG